VAVRAAIAVGAARPPEVVLAGLQGAVAVVALLEDASAGTGSGAAGAGALGRGVHEMWEGVTAPVDDVAGDPCRDGERAVRTIVEVVCSVVPEAVVTDLATLRCEGGRRGARGRRGAANRRCGGVLFIVVGDDGEG